MYTISYGINHEAKVKDVQAYFWKSQLLVMYTETQRVNIVVGVVIIFFIIAALFNLEIPWRIRVL
jgi:hypothetical protein